MNYAFGYIRIDKGHDGKQQAQFAAIRAYYDSHPMMQDVEWSDFYTDFDESYSLPAFNQRPAASKLIETLRPGDHLIVPSTAQASRSLGGGIIAMARLADAGIKVHLLDWRVDTTTAIGVYSLKALLSLVQYGRRTTSERTHYALSAKHAKGLPTNGFAPVGWRKVGTGRDSRFVPDCTERQFIAWLRELNEIQGLSYEKIRVYCRDLGILYVNRRAWDKHRRECWTLRTGKLNAYQPDELTAGQIGQYIRAARKGFPLHNGKTLDVPGQDTPLEVVVNLANEMRARQLPNTSAN